MTEAALPYLLDRVRDLLTRHVRLPGDEYADAIALWVLHAHAVTAATTSPRLIFKSPEKASGKTRALEVLERVVPAPVSTINSSVAYIFRKLKETQVTLLFDETDNIFKAHAANPQYELVGLLNGGWQKGKTIGRCVGEKKQKAEDFPVYAAVALAAIGDLPDTVESRAIIVPMRRRAPDEPLEPFRLRKVVMVTEPLRESLAWWAERYHDELAEHEPQMPDGMNDRQADAWEALVAIGDLAGPLWAGRSRAAAVRIAGGHVIDEASVGVQLLGCIRSTLDGQDRMSTAGLLAALNALDEAQFCGWNEGKGIKARDLAWRLKPYDIMPRVIRLPDGSTPRGYLRADFADAWNRYLPPFVEAQQAQRVQQERIPVADVADVARSWRRDELTTRVRPEHVGITPATPGSYQSAGLREQSGEACPARVISTNSVNSGPPETSSTTRPSNPSGWPRSTVDPRDDLANDSPAWTQLLRRAHVMDGEQSRGLYALLSAFRCQGGRLIRDPQTGSLRLAPSEQPQPGEMTADEYAHFRRELFPHARMLKTILPQLDLDTIHPTT